MISQIIGNNYFLDTTKFIEHNYYDFFPYQNYTDTNIHFPVTKEANEQVYAYTAIPFLTGDSLRKLQLSQEIPNNWFDILYTQDIINRWDDYNHEAEDSIVVNDVILEDDFNYLYKNKDDYLKKFKKHFKMFLLGTVSLNENFSTKLIFVCINDKYIDIKSLFLVNIKNNQLKSITEISECYGYANINKCLDYKDFQIVGNMLFTLTGGWGRYYSGENNDDYKQFDYYPIFYYDDDGFLVVLKTD
jgi:hypothetical protein